MERPERRIAVKGASLHAIIDGLARAVIAPPPAMLEVGVAALTFGVPPGLLQEIDRTLLALSTGAEGMPS